MVRWGAYANWRAWTYKTAAAVLTLRRCFPVTSLSVSVGFMVLWPACLPLVICHVTLAFRMVRFIPLSCVGPVRLVIVFTCVLSFE